MGDVIVNDMCTCMLVLFVLAFCFNFSFVLLLRGICKLMVVIEGLKYFAFSR